MHHQVHKAHKVSSMDEINIIAKKIVDSAFCVHKTIGPGLLESTYEACLLEELKERNLNAECQKPLSIKYKSKTIDIAYRLDLVVEDKILIELKSVERVLPIHTAQIITYLKLSKLKLGFLINFNTPLIKDGIKRFAM